MSAISPISREERLAYIDLFYRERDLAIDSPFHYLVFDEALSPVVQAVTLDQLLELYPTDASYSERVWSCSDVVDFVRAKQKLWQGEGLLPQLHRRMGTMMLYVPQLDSDGLREAGAIETIYRKA
ncbi:hypothetical protein [Synechococcus sp. 8F6]|uniref:hypothetical protein n=1 Tax=Synechococcus sp. 8F6 TaxID=2025606 RepID=UPI000B98D971|nr:hypothetical protein [Synechococcus sp. 8F6]